ncbi:hypothetical protein M9Y10_028392 [Tritrichomonas musculus]|uniref:Exportin-1/Importin-beta-like domain-containing protein n=1 Tax=Tritrichomonas musculus TaxID=1915356 RepID=A0ABR2KKA0_9EUKA
MEIENAVLNLSNTEETIRINAINICSRFQTHQFFDIDVFKKLSNPNSEPIMRIFAFNSLTLIFKNEWNRISQQQKDSISSLFPFHVESDKVNPQFFSIASECVASFLAYTGSEDNIIKFMNSYNIKYSHYFSFFITHFINFLFDKAYPNDRTELLSKFIFGNITSFVQNLLFNSILQMNPNIPEFWMYIQNAALIHEKAPAVIQLYIRNSEAEKFYSYLAQFVWSPSQNGSILSIFEILFDMETNLPETIQALSFSLQSSVPHQYLPLFSFNQIPESEYLYCYELFNNLLVRIPLITSILDCANIDQCGPFLEVFIFLFHSSSPSIIYESATQLQLFLKSIQPSSIPTFFSFYESHIRAIFEATLPLLQVYFGSSPCCPFDHRWQQQFCRESLFDLIRCITETFDGLHAISELLRIIQIDGIESNSFNSIVRIVTSVLSDTNEKITEPLEIEAFNCTVFLLSSINNYSQEIQTKICKLLQKLIPYLEFENQDLLNSFFDQLLDLAINSKYSGNQFTTFLTQFIQKFISRIAFPIERLRNIPKFHPFYYSANNLLAKYAQNGEKSSALNNAVNELSWFTTMFRLNDNSAMKRVTTKVARQFEFLSQINPSEEDTNPKQTSIYENIGLLLIKSNQVIINAGEDQGNAIPLGQYVTLLTQFSPAVSHFSLITPHIYIQHLNELKPPSVLTQAVQHWVTRIAFPIINNLLSILNENQNGVNNDQIQPVYEFNDNVIFKMCQLIDEGIQTSLSSNQNSNSSAANGVENSSSSSEGMSIVKRLIISICDYIKYQDDQHATDVLRVFLKADNFKTFYAVCHAIEEKGISVLSALWPILMKKKDNQSVDKMSEVLLSLYEKNGTTKIFENLPGISKSAFDMLNSKLPNSTSQKSKKKIMRSFIMTFFNNSEL